MMSEKRCEYLFGVCMNKEGAGEEQCLFCLMRLARDNMADLGRVVITSSVNPRLIDVAERSIVVSVEWTKGWSEYLRKYHPDEWKKELKNLERAMERAYGRR